MPHTDVTFKFNNGERINAHKLILTLFSPVFEAEFFGILNQDGEILITDIDPEIFRMLLGYLYTSIPLDVKDKDFDCSKAWNLWYATEKYILPELSESCKSKIQQCVQNHDHYTLLNLVNAVKYHISDYITFHATEKVNKSLDSIIHTEEWKALEEYVFVHILSQENLSLTEGQLFEAILTWCRAQCTTERGEEQKEAVRARLSKFLEYIKWENMSGEEFVDLVSASDALSLTQYKSFSMRIFRANFKGKRALTREMANPLRVYRKAIPCPKAVYNMRGSGNEIYDEPPPRPFHTFKFPHIAVEVETTPQFVALKNEDPQNQLCIKFKTLMTPSKIGRMQIFASVVLENQTEKGKSVFKRMKIADTSSLAPCETPLRFSATPKKSKYVPHQQQMEYGAFFQGGSSSSGSTSGSGGSRRVAPPIRQDMFLVPIHRLEDRKFGFLLRNKTISLNICIDVREVFNAKVVRETVWSSLDSSSGPGTELLTLAKTSNLTDLQAAVEKHLGLETNSFRLWWREHGDGEGGAFRPVPCDASESLWERTDNFVPAIPTAFEQEPELTIFVEENEAEQQREADAGRILVFLKLYDPVSQEITDVGKIFPNCQTEGDSGPVWGLGLRSQALQAGKLQDCGDIYLIQRRTDSVERLVLYYDQEGEPLEREVVLENGDICVVEMLSSPGDSGTLVSFEGFYDTLRNTRDILLKSRVESADYPTEFLLSLTLTTDAATIRQRVRSHLLENQTVNNERLVVEVVELFQCYWSSVSGLSPRSAEFPVDPQFDGSLADLLKSGSKEEPRLYFRATTRLERADADEDEDQVGEEEDSAPARKRARVLSYD